MTITLLRATINNVEETNRMQVKSFRKLLKKYRYYDTNQGNKSMESIKIRLKQNFTYFYFFYEDSKKVGAVRTPGRKSRTHRMEANYEMYI